MSRTSRNGHGFTLVELLVVIGIIGLLVAMLMPALSHARAAANASGSMSNLSLFGRGFALYANANDGFFSSGAFDHNRDGDVRRFGWVSDVMKVKVAIPGQALDRANESKLSLTVAHYTDAVAAPAGARQAGVDAGRWTNLAAAVPATVYSTLTDRMDLWSEGANTDYATTWHFSRGDPTNADKFAPGSSGLRDGDGPLSEGILSNRCRTSAARVALMGPGRPEAAALTGAQVTTLNTFFGSTVASGTDKCVAAMTAGMTVNVAAIAGLGVGNRIHNFSAISPFHQSKNADGTGGFAPILFGDLHVDKVFDRLDSTGAGTGDGYLGNGDAGTMTSIDAYQEVAAQIWVRRLRD